MGTNNPGLFSKQPYWNLTLTQIFIGLSPNQAKFISKVDNEKERVQAADTMSYKIKVCEYLPPIANNWT
jgi:hypothetical protein